MKEKFQRFMIGRYGVDELGKIFPLSHHCPSDSRTSVRSRFLNGVTFLIVLLLYFRMFSKNYAQRRKENDLFLKYKNQVVLFFDKEKTDDAGPGEIPHLHLSQLRTERSGSPEERGRLPSPVRNAKTNSSKKAEVSTSAFFMLLSSSGRTGPPDLKKYSFFSLLRFRYRDCPRRLMT